MEWTTNDVKESIKSNFQKILDKHDAAGLPVVITQDEKTYYYYKDGRMEETERSKSRKSDK